MRVSGGEKRRKPTLTISREEKGKGENQRTSRGASHCLQFSRIHKLFPRLRLFRALSPLRIRRVLSVQVIYLSLAAARDQGLSAPVSVNPWLLSEALEKSYLRFSYHSKIPTSLMPPVFPRYFALLKQRRRGHFKIVRFLFFPSSFRYHFDFQFSTALSPDSFAKIR